MCPCALVANVMLCALQSWDVVEEKWLFESIEQPVPARATAQENIPHEVLLTADDLHISWRGDSKYLATSSRSAPGACWLIKGMSASSLIYKNWLRIRHNNSDTLLSSLSCLPISTVCG